MIRRDFLRRVLYGGTALAATTAAGKALTPRMDHDTVLVPDPLDLTGADSQGTPSLPVLTAIPFRLAPDARTNS
jgi:hypothetical protein